MLILDRVNFGQFESISFTSEMSSPPVPLAMICVLEITLGWNQLSLSLDRVPCFVSVVFAAQCMANSNFCISTHSNDHRAQYQSKVYTAQLILRTQQCHFGRLINIIVLHITRTFTQMSDYSD